MMNRSIHTPADYTPWRPVDMDGGTMEGVHELSPPRTWTIPASGGSSPRRPTYANRAAQLDEQMRALAALGNGPELVAHHLNLPVEQVRGAFRRLGLKVNTKKKGS